METVYKKTGVLPKIGLLLLSLFFSLNTVAQVDPDVQDSTATGYSIGRVELSNPPSIIEAYTYDPVTDRYVYTNSVDGFNINYPIILTPAEYQQLVLRESMRDYFKQKSDAIDGKKEGSEEAKKDLLPRYYVNSGFFETIFGGNTIDVKPTGSVEMDLGIRYTKQDNPAFSPRNRASTTFDFDQRISMSLMGKVGTRLQVTANYDTESTFAFQNLIKLEYTPTEDDIVQKIEVGNVSLPLNSSLIRGAQSLFGVKAQLQFGKTTVTGVFSEQKSQTKTVTAQGGGTIQDFELFGLDYDSDRHFFLSQYFRSKYDASLGNYPFINSQVQITRIEVWVTNRQNRVTTTNNNLRNIIALQDLGEAQLTNYQDPITVLDPLTVAGGLFNVPANSPTDNGNNDLNPLEIEQGDNLLNEAIREIVSVDQGFDFDESEGRHYSKLENARKLAPNEYTFHPQLGYISLQQKLTNDEVLGVAYQYTIGGAVYQVGEFGTDGVDATETGPPDTGTGQPTTIITQALIVKMLKSSLTDINSPVWNLMMKNIYQIPGAFQLEQEDFRFNILYTDPSPLNYITPINAATPFPPPPAPPVAETPLLEVLNVDKLNYNNDPQNGGDGFFDFLPGLTVDAQNGRIIFTTVEPFGKLLFDKLKYPTDGSVYNDPLTYNLNQQKYVFRTMYSSTQSAALQDSEKNKFQLKGRFKSTGGDGIPIGAFNVPRGSVVVTAGGRVLVEGVDYSVNYQLGRVQILDPSLQASNTPIEVSVENNSVFGQQTRRFMGFNIEHQFSEKFLIGATFLKMTERPFTQKSNYGQESVNNTIYGINANYATEVPFLTRMVNKLPNVDTDIISNISVRGEVAFLKPDTPKADQFEGQSTIYVDDFEGSQTTIDMRSPFSWSLSSVPEHNVESDYPDFNASASGLSYGHKRARLSWYSIDPIFYAETPGGLSPQDIGFNSTRRIFSGELYPLLELTVGQSQVVNTLDLTYYPTERGPFNYNPAVAATNEFSSTDAPDNFGGIMRPINSTNFEQANVEYIQFWVMDPYDDDANPNVPQGTNIGKIFFNLGSISEDVLRDGRKQFENGLGADQIIVSTVWGNVPASQSLIYAFDTDAGNRGAQDVGFDGLNDAQEGAKPEFALFSGQADPSVDNYQYYLDAGGSVLERYRNYNGTQGNSPVDVTDTNRGSTTVPDVEDINRDNTMNTINAYYEYSVDIKPGVTLTDRYVADIKEVLTVTTLPTGAAPTSARWIQYKIPISQFENTIGGISDFRSINFMRLFMTGFNDDITIRFGALDLVRGEWRRYLNTLDVGDPNPDDDNTNFDVQAVNIQENADRVPINYVPPPGVVREELFNNNTVIQQNEQSLALIAEGDGLEPGDSRAVFKNVSVDMRQFKRLKMFLHAEAITGDVALQDNEMIGFIRFGNDFTQNFYEVEIPLRVTPPAASLSPEEIWPAENQIDLALDLLTTLKIRSMGPDSPVEDENGIKYLNEGELDPSLSGRPGELRLGIRGNPNFGLVRTLMVGIKNNTKNPVIPVGVDLSERDLTGEVWFNELRLSEMDNKGGWAGVVNIDSNIADFATVSATGRISTIGFGSLEEGPNERRREDVKQYNVVTNLSLGKLLPKKWGLNIPFNYAIGEEIITPEYDPFNQDIRLDLLLDNTSSEAEQDNIRERAIDYTKRKSINFIGVRKERAPQQKQRVYDPENLTLSYSFNETERHDFEIEDYLDQQVNTTVDYAFTFQPKTIEPFKKTKFFKKSSYWKLLSDFNFNYLPSSISFNTNIIRQYNRQQFRQVEVEGIPLDALYRRNFLFNYQYGFNYNLTKALKINYTVATSNIVRNYMDANNVVDESVTIWDDYFDVGTANQHTQQIVVNYELPINKIPAFSFIKSNYSYTGDYNWQRGSLALSNIPYEVPSTGETIFYNLGNTIQNAASHRLNTVFNMDSFYKYIGLVKTAKKPVAKPVAPPKPGEKIVSAPVVQQSEGNILVNGLIGIVTSIKNLQINYTDNRGTVLPGYLPGIGFLGTSRPTVGFVLGSQDDVRFEAAKNGLLTTYPAFNQNFTQVTSKLLNFTANVDLFPDFKIDLTADRAYSKNYSEQYNVDPLAEEPYTPLSPYSFGNFSTSTIMIKTAFRVSDENGSSAFSDFQGNRIVVANRLAENFYGNNTFLRDAEGYPQGFGKNNQTVLIPSFLAAYTGTGILSSATGDAAGDVSLKPFRDIPLPNWVIKYGGLMRYKFFKDRFKRFSLQHGYRASYTVNSFRSNLEYDPAAPTALDEGNNFVNKVIISNVNLVEQFNPLVRVDFEMKNSVKILAEMKKDRALSMSFDNNLLTEVKGIEYIAGLGYRFKDVIISTKLADNPTGIIKSDINIRVDLSYRNNQTIVRYLDYDNNQLAGGQNIWSGKLTADYAFSKNLTAIFYYDHSFSQAVISTSFPMTNIRSGFTLRYNFGN